MESKVLTLTSKTFYCKELVARPEASPLIIGRSGDLIPTLLRTVSRRHAQLRFEPHRGWLISDLESTNGTWLNGKPVGFTATPINHGDEISFGDELATYVAQLEGCKPPEASRAS